MIIHQLLIDHRQKSETKRLITHRLLIDFTVFIHCHRSLTQIWYILVLCNLGPTIKVAHNSF